jgi:tetratricopeptide (TPR) repeat protein
MTTNEMMHTGIKLLESGQLENGLKLITQAINLEPSDPEKRQVRAIFYTNIGNYEEAISDFKHCISLKNDQYEYHYNLANVYFDMKMYGIALVYYTSALKLNQNDSDIFTNRGMCYISNSQPEMAVEDFQTALSINPNDHIARQYLDHLLSFNK